MVRYLYFINFRNSSSTSNIMDIQTLKTFKIQIWFDFDFRYSYFTNFCLIWNFQILQTFKILTRFNSVSYKLLEFWLIPIIQFQNFEILTELQFHFLFLIQTRNFE